jgi:hypothetical protein
MAVMPLIFGQYGERKRLLVQKYGKRVYELAAMFTIMDYLDQALLKKNNIYLPNLKVNSWRRGGIKYFCDKISDGDDDSSKDTDFSKDLCAFEQTPEINLEEEESQAVVDEPMDISVPRPFMSLAISDQLPPETVDLCVTQQLERIHEEACERTGNKSGGTGRGWDSTDAIEFFAQVKRKPKMPWTCKLRTLESKYRASVRTPSRMRPSRRHESQFGRVKKNALLVWFGVDTSGSMGSNDLKYVNAELKGIHERGAAIRVIHCDASIKKMEMYDPHAGISQFKGRGGTDFSPFLIALHNNETEKPGFAVFYTDGYGCARGYLALLRETMGKDAYQNYINSNPTRTPRGVELLWLVPEGRRSLSDLKRDVCIGNCVSLTKGV